MSSEPSAELTESDQQAGQFVSVVLNDTQEIWAPIFRQQVSQTYTPTTFVLSKGVTQSTCGGAPGVFLGEKESTKVCLAMARNR